MASAFDFFGNAAADFGGAASDLFSASGYGKEAEGYGKEEQAYLQAAGLMDTNIGIEEKLKNLTMASTGIQLQANQRAIYQTVGGAKADIASAGLAEHGSALDSIQSSLTQGAIQTQLIQTSGLAQIEQENIQETQFGIQKAAYQGEAAGAHAAQGQAEAAQSAAYASSAGKAVGGVLNTIAGIASIAALFAI